jgi:hypothetical protein
VERLYLFQYIGLGYLAAVNDLPTMDQIIGSIITVLLYKELALRYARDFFIIGCATLDRE